MERICIPLEFLYWGLLEEGGEMDVSGWCDELADTMESF